MNIRKTAVSTISIIMMLAAFCCLILWAFSSLPYEAKDTFISRISSFGNIGSFHKFIIQVSVGLSIFACVWDAIYKQKTWFGVLSSFNVVITFCVAIVILALCPFNVGWFWCSIYFTLCLCLLCAFKKSQANNGSSEQLIAFIKVMKNGAGTGDNHIIDRNVTYVLSMVLALFFAIEIISLLIFILTNINALF